MKKLLIIIVPIILILLIILNNKTNFYLESKYYNSNDLIEIDSNNLIELIDKKESFAIFVYQPSCISSTDFDNLLLEFQEKNNISFYKISCLIFKDLNIASQIKYYPTFIIYKDGKIVDYLKANDNKDLKYYQSIESFTNWFEKYVKKML